MSDDPGTVEGDVVETPFAETFSVVERDGYRIVDVEASIVTWGGSAGGPPQRVRLVLVPKGLEPPALTGDLAGASLIRTPVQRIAVNDQPMRRCCARSGRGPDRRGGRAQQLRR